MIWSPTCSAQVLSPSKAASAPSDFSNGLPHTSMVMLTRSGSTIVTIPADVLERLGTGTHTVTVQFNDGEVNTQLTIKAAETQSNEETTAAETTAAETTAAETTAAETTAADPGRTPTGDSTRPGLWIGLACTAGIACAVAAVLMKKKRT